MKLLTSITGGTGKHIMFTALLPLLAERYEEIHIHSAYPRTFANNPYVTSINEDFTSSKYRPFLRSHETRICITDPYDQEEMIRKESHLLSVWGRLLGLELTDDEARNLSPSLSLSPSEEDKAYALLDQLEERLGSDFFLMQISGGQSPVSFDKGGYEEEFEYMYDALQRSLPLKYAEKLVLMLRRKFPDIPIVRYGLPNEFVPKKIANEMVTLDPPVLYMMYTEICKKASGVITIDSSLQHIAAAANKASLVLWSGTSPDHFGWDLHTNLREEQEDDTHPYFRFAGQVENMKFPDLSNVEVALDKYMRG